MNTETDAVQTGSITLGSHTVPMLGVGGRWYASLVDLVMVMRGVTRKSAQGFIKKSMGHFRVPGVRRMAPPGRRGQRAPFVTRECFGLLVDPMTEGAKRGPGAVREWAREIERALGAPVGAGECA